MAAIWILLSVVGVWVVACFTLGFGKSIWEHLRQLGGNDALEEQQARLVYGMATRSMQGMFVAAVGVGYAWLDWGLASSVAAVAGCSCVGVGLLIRSRRNQRMLRSLACGGWGPDFLR